MRLSLRLNHAINFFISATFQTIFDLKITNYAYLTSNGGKLINKVAISIWVDFHPNPTQA
ncbi:hypothetical protein SOHN41_02638 [Shewanella sp. HN-41]|nr:hypothetical protein SOHN41_02638 [Shewanella sp. HN-41]